MLAASHHRKSIRLKGRDYTWPGTYFLTICTIARKPILGRIQDGVMYENQLGRLAKTRWMEIPIHFANVALDAFIVMPNHVHGMIHLHRRVPANEESRKLPEFGKPQSASIATIVGTFKAAVTRDARRMLAKPAIEIWQRNYY